MLLGYFLIKGECLFLLLGRLGSGYYVVYYLAGRERKINGSIEKNYSIKSSRAHKKMKAYMDMIIDRTITINLKSFYCAASAATLHALE
jgi:hypothetical protein